MRTAVSYAGEWADAACQTDDRDIGGPPNRQVEEALHFVRAAKAPTRAKRPQFSERAVFEARVSPVAHRDCSIAGSRVRLQLFGNGLELCPCRAPWRTP